MAGWLIPTSFVCVYLCNKKTILYEETKYINKFIHPGVDQPT